MPYSNKTAFTLLELIIVIIIVGVLASLALPRFFQMIENSRVTEAQVNIAALRQAIERQYVICLSAGLTLSQRYGFSLSTGQFGPLEIDDPNTSPNSHFNYIVTFPDIGVHNQPDPGSYTIEALRNTLEGPPFAWSNNLTYKQDSSEQCWFSAGIYSGMHFEPQCH